MFNIDELPPPVMQMPGSMDCGLCATRYILHRFGLDEEIETLRAACDWQPGMGSYVPACVKHLQDAYSFETMRPNHLRQLCGGPPDSARLSAYAALLGQGWVAIFERRLVRSPSHIMVADAIDGDRLLVTCSLYGRRWWNAEEFFGGWDGHGDGHLWWLVRPSVFPTRG